MKQLFLVSCFFLFTKADAQQSLRGRILDQVSQNSLSLATVSVFTAQDTRLVNYTLTTTEGDFVVTGIPLNTPCQLVVFAADHEMYRKPLQLTSAGSTELGYIKLHPAGQPEATALSDQAPIMVFKDSIIYTSAAFPTLPVSIRNGILKKLPGIKFEQDGAITAGSQKVKQIRMDRGGLGHLDLIQ